MKTYDLEFSHFNFQCHNFKQKHAETLINSLTSGRVGMKLKFSTYATLTFADDDKQLRYPHIEEMEVFNRLKTNCLIFDVDESIQKYNKLFVMQYIGRTTEYYSYLLYNEETKKFSHHCFLTYDMGDLNIDLTKTFNTIQRYG